MFYLYAFTSNENSIYTRLYFLTSKILKITPPSGCALNVTEYILLHLYLLVITISNIIFLLSFVMFLLWVIFDAGIVQHGADSR